MIRSRFITGLPAIRPFPPGLKPPIFVARGGTAEAVLFQNEAVLFQNEAVLFQNEAVLFQNEAVPFQNEAVLFQNEAVLFQNEDMTQPLDGFYPSSSMLFAPYFRYQGLAAFSALFTLVMFSTPIVSSQCLKASAPCLA